MRPLLLLLLAAGSGCATFVGIEDAEQHLPRLDGEYIIAIDRVRANGTTRDTILMRGTATLDADARSLDLSVGILAHDGMGAVLTETSIQDIAFPADSDEVEYTINLSIPTMGLDPATSPMPDDFSINTPVRFIAEAEYSFCAKRLDGEREVTLGSRLVANLSMLPPPDVDCDDPLRQ
jgi:hypothetical protein